MKKILAIQTSLLALALSLSSCSIDVSDQPQAGEAPTTTEDDAASEVATPTGGAPIPDSVQGEETPGDLDLTGQLYFIGFIAEQPKLLRYDLVTGEETIIFDPPENAWLSGAGVSPDRSQIVLTYAPPPEEGQVQFGFTSLYIMPADGSSGPTPLLQRESPSETFFNVSWPIDEYIYYAHFAPSTDDLGSIVYTSQVERMHYPEGKVEVLATTAAWPRVSANGSKLAYVTEANELVASEANGANPAIILGPEAFTAVDAPLFSPDGSTITFSAVAPPPASSLSLWDRVLGVKVASAHNVPSDWWRMPAAGGSEPERLTNLNAIGLYGDFSADGQTMAFIASDGVYVMRPDGADLNQLREIPTVGTIDWVP